MLGIFKEWERLLNRVSKLEEQLLIATLKIKALCDITYNYYHEDNRENKEDRNGTHKNGKIKTKNKIRKRDNS